jgi:hypothetical protein
MKQLGIVLVLAVLIVAVGIGGYLTGRSGGPDLNVARGAGEKEGRATGTTRGYPRGFEAGMARGERAGYRQTYRRAYKAAYDKAIGE